MATLGSQAVGAIVKLNVNGTAWNWIVVHQGSPGTMYDASCDGTWLLMQDIYEEIDWDDSKVNDYANSDVHSYLNNTFVNLFDSDIKSVIKRVKLPYTQGTGSGGSLKTGSNGLFAKVFLPSYTELGYSGGSANAEGAAVSYFNGVENTKRVAKLNGSAVRWWLRSPNTSNTNDAWHVSAAGVAYGSYSVTGSRGVRPALVLPAKLDVKDGFVKAGGAITGQVNIGGTLKELTGEGYINVGGTLKPIASSQINIGGVLKSAGG